MILPAGPRRVFVATRPVDFRKGMDGLAALAQEQLRLDPFSGVAIVFRAKRADRVKILLWDGSGMVLAAKRLEEGRVCLALGQGWRDDPLRGSACGLVRGPGLASGACPAGPPAVPGGIAAAG